MPSIHIQNITPDRHDTFTCPQVTVQVHNDAQRDLLIDQERTRVEIEVGHSDGAEVLVINEALRRRMLYHRQRVVDAETFLVEAGQQVDIEFDLAQYYYPFKAGTWQLTPVLWRGNSAVRGEPVVLNVSDVAAQDVLEWHENPVFGSQSMLSVTPLGTTLRWLGVNQPRASFFIRHLDGVVPERVPTPARPGFYDLDDLECGFDKVLVWLCGPRELQVSSYREGRLKTDPLRVTTTEDMEALHAALRYQDGRVLVLTTCGEGNERRLHGWSITPDGSASLAIDWNVPADAVRIEAIGAGDLVAILTAGPSLNLAALEVADGTQVHSVPYGGFEGDIVMLNAAVGGGRFKAAYLVRARHARLTLVESELPSVDDLQPVPQSRDVDILLERGAHVLSCDFLMDPEGRLHLLYETSSARLMYRDPWGRFVRMFRRPGRRFFPRLLPGDEETHAPFFGFQLPGRGYRFYSSYGDDAWNGMFNPPI